MSAEHSAIQWATACFSPKDSCGVSMREAARRAIISSARRQMPIQRMQW